MIKLCKVLAGVRGEKELDKESLKNLLLNKIVEYNDREKVGILADINDRDFIMTYLEKEKIGKSSVVELLKILNDCELIKRCIRSKKLKMDIEDKYLLALRINDWGFILGNKKIKKINLPREVSIGIEIESEGENSFFILKEFDYDGWKAKHDNSLENGVEITSAILNADDSNVYQIYMVNEVLKKIGQDETEKCAAHIHVGADYLKSKQAFINLLEIWHNSDRILYAVSNKKGEEPRPQIEKYATNISNEFMNAIESGVITLQDDDDLEYFVHELKMLQSLAVAEKTGGKGRNTGLNLLNVHTAKNTVEFRVPNGTLNSEIWIDNINLFGGIIVVAQRLAEIQEKIEVTNEEKDKIELFDKLKSNIDESQRAEALFRLIGVDFQLYMKKYYANIKIFDKSQWIKRMFGERKIIKINTGKFKKEQMASDANTCSAINQLEAQENIIEGYRKNKEKNIYVSK